MKTLVDRMPWVDEHLEKRCVVCVKKGVYQLLNSLDPLERCLCPGVPGARVVHRHTANGACTIKMHVKSKSSPAAHITAKFYIDRNILAFKFDSSQN